MKRRGQTRGEILRCAEELLQKYGFHGFSYHHIAAQLGVRNAAIHYYFPSKADLGIALVERYRENFRFWAEQTAVRRLNPAQRLEAFFQIERRYLEGGKVCPLGVVGVELPGIPDAMSDATRTLLDYVSQWVTATLEEGRDAGIIHFEGDPSRRATAILAALQGALQLSRIWGNDSFDQTVAQLREEMRLPRPDAAEAKVALVG